MQLLFTKRDEMGFVLVGTQGISLYLHLDGFKTCPVYSHLRQYLQTLFCAETSNPRNRELPDEYLNITVARDIQVPDLRFLESLASVECEDAEGDGTECLTCF